MRICEECRRGWLKYLRWLIDLVRKRWSPPPLTLFICSLFPCYLCHFCSFLVSSISSFSSVSLHSRSAEELSMGSDWFCKCWDQIHSVRCISSRSPYRFWWNRRKCSGGWRCWTVTRISWWLSWVCLHRIIFFRWQKIGILLWGYLEFPRWCDCAKSLSNSKLHSLIPLLISTGIL